MPKSAVLKLDLNIDVSVPDSIDLMTNFVLREQGDWFEDEIKFLRHLLVPGENVIDVGANYGLFSLSAAREVGPTGRIYSFEPASSTAEFLEESVCLNRFTQITVDRSGLSDRIGFARLSLNENPELNQIVRHADDSITSEEIGLTTLDEARKK